MAHQAEAAFFETFRHQFPNANFLEESYRVEEDYLLKFVHTPSLLAALEQDRHLPANKRETCQQILNECPKLLQVTQNRRYVSFDVVVTDDGRTYYWEFHEDQHRRLTVNRESKIYDAETGEAITVPRYVQRLVRDVWRLEHFRPYTIVWKDWFLANQNTFIPELLPGLYEYYLAEKFSFRNFYNL